MKVGDGALGSETRLKKIDLFKLELSVIRAREASANVQQIHVEAELLLQMGKSDEFWFLFYCGSRR